MVSDDVSDEGNIEGCARTTRSSISSTKYYKDDSCWSTDLKSKTTEDIISNRSFMEVLVLNHYVLVKKVLSGAHIGYNFPLKVPIISNPEPCPDQYVDEFPQTLPSFHPTCYSGDENSFAYDSTPNFVDDSPNIFSPPSQPLTDSYEFCGNDAHYSHDYPPQVPFIYNLKPCYNQDFNFPQSFQQQYPCCESCGGPHKTFQCQQVIFYEPSCENCRGPHENFQCQPMNQNFYKPNLCYNSISFDFDQFQPPQFPVIHQAPQKTSDEILHDHENELAEYINTLSWNRHAFYNYDDDDDEDYTNAITPVLSTEEPDNSLSMGDEHLDTISAIESDEVIKSSVEDLVPIPSESESILDNMCDVPFRDNSPPLDISKDQFKDLSDSNNDSTLIDDDYFSIDDIDYVEASPPDSEHISLEEVKDDILLSFHISYPIEDSDSFFKKSDTSLSYLDNSLPEFETFSDHTEETSSGSTTTHADYSLPKYDSFLFEIEPDQGELTSVVMEDILGEPRVHVPNVLPTHPTLMLDSDFIPFNNSLPKSEIFYFDIEEKNSGNTTIHANISLPNFDHFYFKIDPDPDELTSNVDSGIRENVLSATTVNVSPKDDQSPLFTYVVWIFLPFLTYPVAPPYLLSSGNEDTIFDPGISIYHSLYRVYIIGVELS
uniref:Uncharacterized protein n=1 Tax=Tanacetum cinerariifolium TaxID=118510 RepID=A0A6L2JW60_TANCI|nr:hypothetical protein [Tanacetum cinerariifolium]